MNLRTRHDRLSAVYFVLAFGECSPSILAVSREESLPVIMVPPVGRKAPSHPSEGDFAMYDAFGRTYPPNADRNTEIMLTGETVTLQLADG
ncbi:hypothetical protein [Brucella endophytica]|nr:hypothetical protein [Brucella endophytica]